MCCHLAKHKIHVLTPSDPTSVTVQVAAHECSLLSLNFMRCQISISEISDINGYWLMTKNIKLSDFVTSHAVSYLLGMGLLQIVQRPGYRLHPTRHWAGGAAATINVQGYGAGYAQRLGAVTCGYGQRPTFMICIRPKGSSLCGQGFTLFT